MRAVSLLVGLLVAGVGVVDGANACFDACESGSESLFLYGCNLTDDDIPDILACFDQVGRGNIESLNVAVNYLAVLPEDTFEGFGSLVNLLLNGNQLSAITPGLFAGLGSLQNLYLMDNQLSTLSEGLFDGLGSLEYLSVSQNQLTSIPAGAFEGLGTLANLYMTNNELTTLPEGLFDDLVGLQRLHILRNPDLQCVPTNVAAEIKTDEISFVQCECTPAEAIMCDEDRDCVPGEYGYTCVNRIHKTGVEIML